MLIIILITIIFLSPLSGAGETKVLFVDGGASADSNYYRYYNEVRNGYESVKSKGWDAAIIAKDGKWRLERQGNEHLSKFALTKSGKADKKIQTESPTYPPIVAKATSADDFANQIEKMQLKQDDTLLVFMTGHGDSPDSDPETATYSFWENDSSWKEIAHALGFLNPRTKIKIITKSCYGGGVHHLSRVLPNVCTASAVPFFTLASSGIYQESFFSQSLWETFRKEKNPSFASLSLAAFSGDIANVQLGNLSSFDYVDYVLKKGVYDGVKREDLEISEKDIPELRKKYRDSLSYIEQPENIGSVFSSASLLSSRHNLLAEGAHMFSSVCLSGAVSNSRNNLAMLENLLKELVGNMYVVRAEGQDPRLRVIFHDVIDDMKKNGESYLGIAVEYDEKFHDLRTRVQTFRKKKDRDWKKDGEVFSRFQEEFDTLKKNAEKDLAQFNFDQKMLDRLDRLEAFNKIASPEQKRKFIQLLRCEWDNL